MTLAEQIARCDREIAAYTAGGDDGTPAILVAMGVLDWELEKHLLQKQLGQVE